MGNFCHSSLPSFTKSSAHKEISLVYNLSVYTLCSHIIGLTFRTNTLTIPNHIKSLLSAQLATFLLIYNFGTKLDIRYKCKLIKFSPEGFHFFKIFAIIKETNNGKFVAINNLCCEWMHKLVDLSVFRKGFGASRCVFEIEKLKFHDSQIEIMLENA